MSAADLHPVGHDAVDDASTGLDREWSVLIVCALPLRVRRQDSRHVHRVVGNHELVFAGRDEEHRMARCVAVSVKDSHAWRDFSAALDELPVLPFGKVFGDSPTCGLAAFGQLVDAPGLSPELILDA